MRPLLLFGLAVVLITARSAESPAGVAGRPIFPYKHLHTPAEAVSSAAGGPAVAMIERLKSTVVIEPGSGGGCGLAPPTFEPQPESSKPRPDTEPDSGKTRLYLLGVGAVGVLLLLGWLLLRR